MHPIVDKILLSQTMLKTGYLKKFFTIMVQKSNKQVILFNIKIHQAYYTDFAWHCIYLSMVFNSFIM